MKKYLFILLFQVIFVINAEESVKKSWSVEWGALEGKNLSLSNKILLNIIPTYFRDNIDTELYHFLDDVESKEVHKKIVKKRVTELQQELSLKYNTKDKLFFETKRDEKKYDKLVEDIEKLRVEIKKNQNKDIGKLEPIKSLPILYSPTKDNKFSFKKEIELEYYLEKSEIDYYITGVLEELGDNLLLDIKLYSRYNDNPITIWSGIGSSEEILGYRKEILDQLIKHVISPNIVEYKVEAEPSDALIYINNKFKGLGRYNGYILNGNKFDIKLSKEGYETQTMTRGDNNLSRTMKFELKPLERDFINLNSLPSGASIYYGSRYMGTTPLDIPKYSYAQKLTISLDGYLDKSLIIDQKSISSTIKLKPGVVDKESNYILKKSRFYRNTAIFSFSLAIPLFLGTQGDNINSTVYNISIGNAFFWGINLFIDLFKYLKAAELSVE